jgi:hypothetical protein
LPFGSPSIVTANSASALLPANTVEYFGCSPGQVLNFISTGWILDDSRVAPLSYATYNLLFVNDYADGLIHTEAEHRTWLEEAGFEYVLRELSAPSYAADFILARKPSRT